MVPRDHPGGPWGQHDGHEVVRNRIFIDFGVILRPVYISFLIPRSLQFHFVSGLFPGHFFIDVRSTAADLLGPWAPGDPPQGEMPERGKRTQ